MKYTRTLRRALGPVVVGCLVGATAVRAQSEWATASAPAAPTVKAEMIRLLQVAAAKVPSAPTPATPVVAVSAVDMIAPVIVRGENVPNLRFYRETPSAHFFRTGTFSRVDGPHVTTRCWARGDAGVMLSFSW